MKEIKLTQGFVALVDDEDYDCINQFNWHLLKGTNTNYARRNVYINKKQIGQLLHHFILKITRNDLTGLEVDHKNQNGLDNQKNNLRVCNRTQNVFNRSPIKNCSSKFKGVSWHKRNKKYTVSIRIKTKLFHLGSFTKETDAAIMYNIAAKKMFKDFAFLNVIIDMDEAMIAEIEKRLAEAKAEVLAEIEFINSLK